MITGFTARDIPDQSGKTFFITGANTGIGFEAANAIAGRGGRVLLGCRNPQKGQDALQRISAAHPSADIALVIIDLGDLASVARAAEEVAQEPRLDVLINNAGIMFNPRTLTSDGFESQLGVNHLGHFALTGHLLPALMKTPDARIVSISSMGHRFGNGDMFWDDINAEKEYSPQTRYFASKLANLLFTYELDRRLRAAGASALAVAAHPGGADTELDRHITGPVATLFSLIRPLASLVVNTAEQGAWPTELAATHPDVLSGQYFGPGRLREISGPARQVDSSNASKDLAKAKRLWDLSIQMTGVDPGI
jgi:NAD(P)-dependent dehydrogenase (short-subunit alcohol dehydrogenase family)